MSDVIAPVGVALAEKLATLSISGETVKAYWLAPRTLDRIPAAVIEAPSVERRQLEEPESALGADDWLLSFPVTLYVLLDEAEAAQSSAVEFVEAFTLAIDADRGLGVAGVIEARVVSSEPVIVDDERRALYTYQSRVEVLREHIYS